MAVFVDTSALYAALNGGDDNHQAAREGWAALAQRRERPFTTNYVLVETMALVGHRMGLQPSRDFHTQFVPVLRVYWVDQFLHERAVSALLTGGGRGLSPVDCVSFEVMRQLGLDTAFTFDPHFAHQGFQCIP